MLPRNDLFTKPSFHSVEKSKKVIGGKAID